MNNNTKIIIGLFVFVCLMAVITLVVTKQADNRIDENTVATFSNQPGEASYTDLDGNEVILEQYLGNILVVSTWASWSPYSATDLPLLSKLAEEYDSKQVTFLAINRKETKEQAARFISTMPDLDNLILVLDPRDHFYTSVGGYAMPEVVVYNKQGEITQHFRGDANEAKIKEVINQLLNPN